MKSCPEHQIYPQYSECADVSFVLYFRTAFIFFTIEEKWKAVLNTKLIQMLKIIQMLKFIQTHPKLSSQQKIWFSLYFISTCIMYFIYLSGQLLLFLLIEKKWKAVLNTKFIQMLKFIQISFGHILIIVLRVIACLCPSFIVSDTFCILFLE